jgi:transposase
MKKEVLLLNKINLLLARVNAPKHLNKYGSKKYTLAEKLHALFLRAEWRASFRRTKRDCSFLGISCPSKSALQNNLARLPRWLLGLLLKITAGLEDVAVAAIDATGLQQSMPSWHYVNRAGIDIKQRKPAKLSILISTRSKKILAANYRKSNAHDIRDARKLLLNSAVKPAALVADKAYDAEWLHEYCHEIGIKPIIPVRKGIAHGFYRKRMRFNAGIYHRRSMVESAFSKLKRMFGSSMRCISVKTQRSEIFCSMILYNLLAVFWRFRTQPIKWLTL